ncbi:low-specificity L-threonine aldolase [Fictibacillus sp. KIGAM418]|uniref:Low-specificity L-threonine aldolase n=1 Tax=Fictibacillus marinisediminis TaxID=2878389 RepID=A0A9X1XDS3_9BACL|nr:low-specificity L-threonine aldolase [Fictibacillus marinisediminis]MCK6257190.1 low-specificity L-threonine aldolase [Fictibacillus marinisediminis]
MIDLRSDTVTKPTEEMRRAMYEAEVGDDVYSEDPSINALEEAAAEILGKENALFVTSGTQGNQVAILTHSVSGSEVIMEADSHIFMYEAAAASAFAGIQPRPLKGIRGSIQPEDLLQAIRSEDIHHPETSLVCLENTHNRAGGAVISAEDMAAIYKICRTNKIPVHLDGARLFNAAAASNLSVKTLSSHCDTVQICLSKGLGAPAGSILAGSASFIHKAKKWRKRLGGGLRQGGVLAAPGMIALKKMAHRLHDDHIKAAKLAQSLAEQPALFVENRVDTNIVLVNIGQTGFSTSRFLQLLKEEGVLAVAFGPQTIRFTTHYEISIKDIEQAIEKISKIVSAKVILH